MENLSLNVVSASSAVLSELNSSSTTISLPFGVPSATVVMVQAPDVSTEPSSLMTSTVVVNPSDEGAKLR